jgi:site-specific recombinase
MPEWKREVSLIFQNTLQELSGIEFFCEVGLPKQLGMIGELGEKLMDRVLPSEPIGNQLGNLLLQLFPTEKDARWIETIDEQSLEKIFALFSPETGQKNFPHLESDIEESMIYLVSQIVAIGLSPLVRKRIPHRKMKSLPFFYLPAKLNLYLKIKHTGNEHDPALIENLYFEFMQIMQETEEAIGAVYQHLNEYGVNVHLVYQLERMKCYVKRVCDLLEMTSGISLDKKKVAHFTSELIRESLTQQSAVALVSNNVTLLAQKIVDRNSHTGEHYIAQNSKEYLVMLKKALGGGFVTAFTVYIKNFLLVIPVTRFLIGAFASMNYAVSFLLIHFCGFTLGTKQPASTAPALAHKLELLEDFDQVETVTDEIVMTARTQFVAVLGNILSVAPVTLLFTYIFHAMTGNWLMDPHAAEHNLHATDILGPAIPFAVFTGILLWLSSIAAGWSDNWFAFNNLHYLIANNKKGKMILGAEGTKKFAGFLERNISGIAANVSLGILLGVVPEILQFLGLPLEVRHVTLSSGALAASLPTLGWNIIETPIFWRNFIGLLTIGFLNIFVSFSLAFFVAVRAKKISSRKRRLIYRSVYKRFIQRPLSFFIPT